MAALQPTRRKTRFVCVSDTHNAVPGGAFRLPKGDVLLHAGDMTNQGSYSELQKAVKWIEEADFEAKIVIAGNHDITLDPDFYALHGQEIHNQHPEDPAKCQQLLDSSSILWLKHGSAVVNLQSPAGPRTTFKIFGSPYSLAWGRWAFGYEVEEATRLWKEIPPDTNIVMTHTPPMHHCDKGVAHQRAGCMALLDALQRIRPRLAVCGHIHEGRGAEFVRWKASESERIYDEERTIKWNDPAKGSKDISLVDLTIGRDDGVTNTTRICHGDRLDADNPKILGPAGTPENPARQGWKATIGTMLDAGPSLATQDHGNASHKSPALEETCIVNAAIMASSYHARSGGKRFNRPIVVDIDLPMWET